MPIINVKVSGAKSSETTARIADLLLDLTTNILGKKREVTAIAIDYVDPDHWIIAGKSLSAHGKASFYFNITITDETNTKDEKARYIKAAFDGFAGILGELHEESYIYVRMYARHRMVMVARRRNIGTSIQPELLWPGPAALRQVILP